MKSYSRIVFYFFKSSYKNLNLFPSSSLIFSTLFAENDILKVRISSPLNLI